MLAVHSGPAKITTQNLKCIILCYSQIFICFHNHMIYNYENVKTIERIIDLYFGTNYIISLFWCKLTTAAIRRCTSNCFISKKKNYGYYYYIIHHQALKFHSVCLDRSIVTLYLMLLFNLQTCIVLWYIYNPYYDNGVGSCLIVIYDHIIYNIKMHWNKIIPICDTAKLIFTAVVYLTRMSKVVLLKYHA